MAKKKAGKSRKTLSPTARVELLLDRLYERNQSRMAADLGCSQALISKIVTRKQNPGARFMESLAHLPKVNPAWVQTGEGEPLLAERKIGHDGGWPVPIAETILPGSPSSHSEMLTGRMELVSGAVYRDSAYIVAVTPDLTLIHDTAERISPGDRIMLDANPRRWRSNLRILNRKLCAVRRDTPKGPHIELRRVTCSFTGDGKDVELSISASPEPELYPGMGKELKPDPTATKEEFQQSAPTQVAIAVDDIVAIAIQLIRDM